MQTQNRTHLTVSDVCSELGIARSTFYDWRAARKAPSCIRLPTGHSHPANRPGALAQEPRRARRDCVSSPRDGLPYDVKIWKIHRYKGAKNDLHRQVERRGSQTPTNVRDRKAR